MKKFFAGLSLAVLLGTGGAVGLGAASASAHDHTDTVTCQAATVDLTNYDGTATVKVTLDGVVVKDTAPFGGQYHYNQPLTYDASHQTHTLKVEVVSADPGYSFTHTDTSPSNCYTPPDSPTATVGVTSQTASCTSASVYTEANFPIQHASWVEAIQTSAGTYTRHATAAAHYTFADGTTSASVSYTVNPKVHNASCVAPITCTVTGTQYTEADDHAPVLTEEGYSFKSAHDGHSTGLLFPVHGNLQGINNISYSTSNVVGNGIYFRIIVDLTADGGSAYNSLSVVSNTITQASVADVGSKSVFLGKTIAQIANLYPDAVYTSMGWATGSAYAAGDGATLTGFAGDCGSGSFVPTKPADTHRTTDTNGDVVCTAGGVGGGSYDETVTKYTTSPVWNPSTQSYDLVETVDSGYPVVTTRTVDASLQECPIHAVPVNPSVKAVCDADDTVTLATTDNITYAVTSSDKKGATVTATPAAATVLDTTAGWTVASDGTATFQVTYDNSACPLQLVTTPNGLAFTGSDPTGIVITAGGLLATGGIALLVVFLIRRRNTASE